MQGSVYLCLSSFVSLHILQIALTAFFGIGRYTAHRICARLHIHDRATIDSLNPQQVTALASFLSSPSTSPPPPRLPLASSEFVWPKVPSLETAKESKKPPKDVLANLKIETELKREILENIAHQRMIGSYVGRRHATGMPVRGQNTQTNAKIAKRLNRVERRL